MMRKRMMKMKMKRSKEEVKFAKAGPKDILFRV